MNKKISVVLAILTLMFSGLADAAQPAKTRLLMKTKNASISVTNNIFTATVHNPTGQYHTVYFHIIVRDPSSTSRLVIWDSEWQDVAPFTSVKLRIRLDARTAKRIHEYVLRMDRKSLIPTLE